MVRAVKGMRPVKGARVAAAVEAAPEDAADAEREPESALWQKIQAQQFVVSVELTRRRVRPSNGPSNK